MQILQIMQIMQIMKIMQIMQIINIQQSTVKRLTGSQVDRLRGLTR